MIGEPCSIWYVDTHTDGWPFVESRWVESCPINCFGDIAGDYHRPDVVWCEASVPPPNLPGIDAGAYCSASTSRTITLMTAGTLGTRFEIEGPSGVVEATSFVFTDLPEGENRFRARAHNDGGSSEWTEWVSVYHDYSPPSTTAHFVGLVGMNDWYISPVSTTFNMSDNGCFGVSATTYTLNGATNTYTGSPFNILNEGFNTLAFSSTDGHHPENEHSATIQIDTLVPSLSISPDRLFDVSSGWWTSPLTVTIHADDATSGISSLEYNLNGGGWTSGNSLTLSTDGVFELDVQATDNAGHVSYDGVILPIDTSAPVLDVQITGEQGDNNWFITPPTLTLSATDATSGVIGVLYQVENGSQQLYTAPLTFVREGLYSLQAFAVDEALHITTRTAQIGYDITPPQTNIILTETSDGMMITLNRWDGVSGFALTRMAINGVWGDYHHPMTVSEVGDYWVQFYTIDFAGNIEAEKIVSFTIAETGVVVTQVPPVVNIIPPANPPTTPPFETREDFPPDLHDEGVYFTYPEDNRVADTAYPPSQIIFAGGNANNGSPIVPMENRISRSPVIRESDMTTNTMPLFPLEGRFPTDRQPRISTLPYIRSESFEPNRMGEDYVDTTLAPQPTSNVVFVTDTTSAQGASETPSSPLDVTMLAMLGLTMAGAGVMKSQTAVAKQKKQATQKAQALAQLQAQQSVQAQTAGANWEQNQVMQASAKQAVVTQVMQSQANKDFWVAYSLWLYEVSNMEIIPRLQMNVGQLTQLAREAKRLICDTLKPILTSDDYTGLSTQCKQRLSRDILPLLCNEDEPRSRWGGYAHKGIFQRIIEYHKDVLRLDYEGKLSHRRAFRIVRERFKDTYDSWKDECAPFGVARAQEVEEFITEAEKWRTRDIPVSNFEGQYDVQLVLVPQPILSSNDLVEIAIIAQTVRTINRGIGQQNTYMSRSNDILIRGGGGAIKLVM